MAKIVKCDYCNNPAEYIADSVIYGRSYGGMMYACMKCQAWVGCHKGTDKPLGRLANNELRQWKQKAHAVFDPLWKAKLKKRRKERGTGYKKGYARGSGYKWLAEQLNISSQQCHIGMFDVDTCKKVVEICKPYGKVKA